MRDNTELLVVLHIEQHRIPKLMNTLSLNMNISYTVALTMRLKGTSHRHVTRAVLIL